MSQSDVDILSAPPAHDLAALARIAHPHLRRSGAERAIVFGSYARGTADRWSDLDLVVVFETEEAFTARGLLLLELVAALPVAVDLPVYTPAGIERLTARGYGLLAQITKDRNALVYQPAPFGIE